MRVRSALLFTVLRLLAFLVPFGVLMLFPVFQEGLYWLAAIFAALIGLSLSVLFLRRPRETIAGGLAERRAERTDAARESQRDADTEDAADDARRDADG
ncbi:DUF4229 domain-containing protein [Microbacterium sp. P06]|uniref:DUF4229 domain-containing protein n=1 Tax=unclassified Microbacterium TaxID=2609290 RepID=UPI0037471722